MFLKSQYRNAGAMLRNTSGVGASWRAPTKCRSSSAAALSPGKKVLLLGGTGFVGQQLIRELTGMDYSVVSVSRRAPASKVNVKYLSRDLVSRPEAVGDVLREEGPFIAVLHAVGMLLPNEFNALASGSGSTPSPGTTFDQITRQTALAAAEAVAEQMPGAPLCFVSAAEAGWTTDPPFLPSFMVDYLAAKRAVEGRLLEMGQAGTLRPIILRPSLIWTPARPAAIPAVAAFALANAIGIPGIDRPVMVDTLAKAAVRGITRSDVSGILNNKQMETLAAM